MPILSVLTGFLTGLLLVIGLPFIAVCWIVSTLSGVDIAAVAMTAVSMALLWRSAAMMRATHDDGRFPEVVTA